MASNDSSNPVVTYFRDAWHELNKITWPTRKQALNLTGIVLLITFAMAAVIGLIDSLFTAGYNQLIELLS